MQAQEERKQLRGQISSEATEREGLSTRGGARDSDAGGGHDSSQTRQSSRGVRNVTRTYPRNRIVSSNFLLKLEFCNFVEEMYLCKDS